MPGRAARAALAEQTALADHYLAQLDEARTQLAARTAELAVTEAVGRALLVRNAELAARPPIEVIVQGREVVDAVKGRLDEVLWDMELEGSP